MVKLKISTLQQFSFRLFSSPVRYWPVEILQSQAHLILISISVYSLLLSNYWKDDVWFAEYFIHEKTSLKCPSTFQSFHLNRIFHWIWNENLFHWGINKELILVLVKLIFPSPSSVLFCTSESILYSFIYKWYSSIVRENLWRHSGYIPVSIVQMQFREPDVHSTFSCIWHIINKIPNKIQIPKHLIDDATD